jgi:hypothetical protein
MFFNTNLMSVQKLETGDFEALFNRWNNLCDQHDAADDVYAPPATDIAAGKTVLAWKLAQYWHIAVDGVPALGGVLTHEGVSLQACSSARSTQQGVLAVQEN